MDMAKVSQGLQNDAQKVRTPAETLQNTRLIDDQETILNTVTTPVEETLSFLII